jgi:hypothetical protein
MTLTNIRVTLLVLGDCLIQITLLTYLILRIHTLRPKKYDTNKYDTFPCVLRHSPCAVRPVRLGCDCVAAPSDLDSTCSVCLPSRSGRDRRESNCSRAGISWSSGTLDATLTMPPTPSPTVSTTALAAPPVDSEKRRTTRCADHSPALLRRAAP